MGLEGHLVCWSIGEIDLRRLTHKYITTVTDLKNKNKKKKQCNCLGQEKPKTSLQKKSIYP